MKSRSLTSTVTIVVVVISLIFVSSWFWFQGRSLFSLRQGGVKTDPQSTMFVSKQAPLVVSLLVNPDKLSKFKNLRALRGKKGGITQEISQISANLLSKVNLDYQRDLQGWLGDELLFAVTSLDFDRDADNGVRPGYLLILKNKDPQLAREFLQGYYSQAAIAETSELVLEQYQGVNLISQKSLSPSGGSQVASTVVRDFVLFANDLRVLKEAINNAQAINLNLAHHPPYEQAIKTMSQPKIGLAYLNLPSMSAWIAKTPAPENPTIQQPLTLSLSLHPAGLVVNTALLGVAGVENQAPALSAPPDPLNYIPTDSIVVASGVALNQLWQQITAGLPQDSPLQQIVNQAITPLETSLKLNLAEDIFSWVGDEYAVALLKDEMADGLNWVLVTENTEVSALAKLDDLARARGLSVGSLPVLDGTMTAWTKLITTSTDDFASLQAQVKGVHTNIDGHDLLTNSVDVLVDVLSASHRSLIDSDKFQAAIKALPAENDGYLYVDWPAIEPIVSQKFPVLKVVQLAFKPLFDNLRSLTIASEGAEGGVLRATVFLRLS